MVLLLGALERIGMWLPMGCEIKTNKNFCGEKEYLEEGFNLEKISEQRQSNLALEY